MNDDESAEHRRHVDVRGGQGIQVTTHGSQRNVWSIVNIVTTPIAAAIVMATVVLLAAAALYLQPWAARPDVGLVDYSVAAPGKVDGNAFQEAQIGDGPMQRSDLGANDVAVTPVDITLKNDGAASAVVVEAVVTVAFAEHLEDCAQTGGPLQVEANYDLRIPAEPPARPFTLRHDMRFEVEPHRSERFTLTIGPAVQHAESWDARLYVAAVSLELDYTDQPLTVGNAAWVARAGDGFDNLNAGLGTDDNCLRRNAALVAKLGSFEAERSEEATVLIKRWAHLTAGDGAVRRPTCADLDYDPERQVAGFCALYAPDVVVATVSLQDTEPARIVLRFRAADGTTRWMLHCRIRAGDPDVTREVTLTAPGAVPAEIQPCSDYQRGQVRVTLYAYPPAALQDEQLTVLAAALPDEDRREDVPADEAETGVRVYRSV